MSVAGLSVCWVVPTTPLLLNVRTITTPSGMLIANAPSR